MHQKASKATNFNYINKLYIPGFRQKTSNIVKIRQKASKKEPIFEFIVKMRQIASKASNEKYI